MKTCQWIWLFALLPSMEAYAKTMDDCVLEKYKGAKPDTTVGDLKKECETLLDVNSHPEPASTETSLVSRRMRMEQHTKWNPFVISPYKQNYLLPATYVTNPNDVITPSGKVSQLDHAEAKMQLSIKVPLTHQDLLATNDSVDFGFTLQAFWQAYNHKTSTAFRESDYQPEIFYTLPLQFGENSTAALLRFGAEHQSNGEEGMNSRSWNRFFTQFVYAYENYVISLRPWYRIPEKKKQDAEDNYGDDNPDIEKYMGYFELSAVAKHDHTEYSVLLRNNLRDENYGAAEIGISFPLSHRLRGYLQYFNGYGESLIDYNHRIERVGLGILLTDFM